MENKTADRIGKLLHGLVLLLVVIQPVIDMDYLFYEQFQAIGLPRLATIVRFLVLPSLVLVSFAVREPKKVLMRMVTMPMGTR